MVAYFLSSPHEELNMSPETILQRTLLEQPGQPSYARVLNKNTTKSIILYNRYSNSVSLADFNRSESIETKNATPIPWDESRHVWHSTGIGYIGPFHSALRERRQPESFSPKSASYLYCSTDRPGSAEFTHGELNSSFLGYTL